MSSKPIFFAISTRDLTPMKEAMGVTQGDPEIRKQVQTLIDGISGNTMGELNRSIRDTAAKLASLAKKCVEDLGAQSRIVINVPIWLDMPLVRALSNHRLLATGIFMIKGVDQIVDNHVTE